MSTCPNPSRREVIQSLRPRAHCRRHGSKLGQLYGRPKQSVAAPSALPKRSAASQRKHSHSSSTLRPRRSPRLAENVRLPKPDAEHEEALPRSHRILGVDHSTRSAGATAPQQRIVPIETGSSQSVSAVVAVHMSASCQMESPAPVSQPVAPQAKAMEPHTCTLQRELDKALRERDELFNDNVLLVEGYRELQNQMESKEASLAAYRGRFFPHTTALCQRCQELGAIICGLEQENRRLRLAAKQDAGDLRKLVQAFASAEHQKFLVKAYVDAITNAQCG